MTAEIVKTADRSARKIPDQGPGPGPDLLQETIEGTYPLFSLCFTLFLTLSLTHTHTPFHFCTHTLSLFLTASHTHTHLSGVLHAPTLLIPSNHPLSPQIYLSSLNNFSYDDCLSPLQPPDIAITSSWIAPLSSVFFCVILLCLIQFGCIALQGAQQIKQSLSFSIKWQRWQERRQEGQGRKKSQRKQSRGRGREEEGCRRWWWWRLVPHICILTVPSLDDALHGCHTLDTDIAIILILLHRISSPTYLSVSIFLLPFLSLTFTLPHALTHTLYMSLSALHWLLT